MPAGASPAAHSKLARDILLELLKESEGLSELPGMAVTPDGKPFFPGRPDLRFSLSHTKGAAMAVIGDREVGCDIEEIDRHGGLDILDYAFSPEERETIVNAPDSKEALTRIWTRKEASVKMRGAIPDNPASWPSEGDGEMDIMFFSLPSLGCVASICAARGSALK